MHWILLILLSLIWGSSFILIKKGLEVYPDTQLAAIRLLIAFISLLPVVIMNFRKIKVQHFKYLSIVAICGSGIPAFLFATAQTQVPSAVAGMLNSLTPLFTLLLGAAVFGLVFSMKNALGILLGLIGALILLFAGNAGKLNFNMFGLLIVIATVLYATSINVIKNFLSEVSSLSITAFSMAIAGIPAGIYLAGTDFPERLMSHEGAGIALFYIALLAVFGTSLGLLLLNRLIKISSPLFAASISYLVPVVAAFWGLLVNESLKITDYAGMTIILMGVYLVNQKPRR